MLPSDLTKVTCWTFVPSRIMKFVSIIAHAIRERKSAHNISFGAETNCGIAHSLGISF